MTEPEQKPEQTQIIKKPEAIVSLLKDIKFAHSLNIIGELEEASIDAEGKMWLQISKENKEMCEAIVKVLKNLKDKRMYLIIRCDDLDYVVNTMHK